MKAILGITVVVSLLAGSGWAAENTPGEEVHATVKPASIMITRYRSFDSKFAMMNRDTMNVTLTVTLEPGTPVIGWKTLTVTEAVTDTGESVEPVDRMYMGNNLNTIDDSYARSQRAGGYSFQASVALKSPVKNCRSIQTLSGSLTVALAKGKLKRAELKPLKDVLGKPLTIAGIADAEVTVERRTGRGGITVTMPAALQGRFRSIECFDGTGAPIEARHTGGSGNGTQFSRDYNADLADDGSVVVVLYPEVVMVPVPFTVKDILLPGVEAPAETNKGLIIHPVDTVDPTPTNKGDAVPVSPKTKPTR